MICSLLASPPSENEALMPLGRTANCANSDASTVNATGTVREEGLALGTVTATLPS